MSRKQLIGIVIAGVLALMIATVLVGGTPEQFLNFGYGYGY